MLGPKVIPFCRNRRCCPVVTINGDRVSIGGDEEGLTFMSLSQFQDLVEAAKGGKFDGLFELRDAGNLDTNFQYKLDSDRS